MEPVCSVSVDLDALRCYHAIHGLPPTAAPTVFRRAVPRFLELFAELRVCATFFVVGEDLDDPESAAQARALVAAGHELGNHTETHPYDLARLTPERVREEILRAEARLDALGQHPRGFRGPGYAMSPLIQDILVERGYRYDSSAFPAPGYYAAKAAVMAGLRLLGRPSGATLAHPRYLLCPPDPYHPAAGAPHRRGDLALVQLPVAVTPGLRLPAIGTTLATAPGPLGRLLVRLMEGRPHFGLELHGIDLLDAAGDEVDAALAARQPDLKVPLPRKLARLREALGAVARRRRLVTCAEAAADVG